MIYPITGYVAKNRACEVLWESLRSFNDEDLSSLHEIPFGDDVADCIILAKEKVILILSVRDYTAQMIKGITNKNMVQLKNRPSEPSGVRQAIRCRAGLLSLLGDETVDKRTVAVACCYPFISQEEYPTTELDKLCPLDMTFLAEDLIDGESFKKKLESIKEHIVSSIGEEVLSGSLNGETIEKMIKKLDLCAPDEVPETKEEVGVFKADLRASNNKELYHGICSFLMRNGIKTGFIFSRSPKILDGLGDYMTKVKIPWSYSFENREVGYTLADSNDTEMVKKADGTIIDVDSPSRISVRIGQRKQYNIEVHDPNTVYDSLLSEDKAIPLHLKNDQIRRMFLRTFVIAEEEIDIISPWMNFRVVDEKFVELMRSALDRGVKIRIIYGLTSSSSEYDISRSERSDQVASYLLKIFKDYGDQIKITRDNIHYKLVLCDEKFKLEGGYNYLSFVGDYENPETRKEGSPYGTQVEEIRYLRKEYFGDGATQ